MQKESLKKKQVKILQNFVHFFRALTHWGQVAHICVSKLTIIGSDNGLSPGRRQAIIWTNAGILLIGPLVTNFSEILIEIYTFFNQENASENVVWEMVVILSRPQCVNVLITTAAPFSINAYRLCSSRKSWWVESVQCK